MDAFPIELWTKIFQNLSKNDWLALSRVCRLSGLLAQVELYKTIHLSQNLLVGCTLSDKWEKNLLARSLVHHPDLAKLVRAMEISPTFAWRHRLGTFANIPVAYRLVSFSNLQSLRIYNLHIDAEFRSAIISLTCLTSLSLSHCDIGPSLHAVNSYDPVPGRPMDLSIYWPNSSKGWNAIVPGVLRSLTIADPSAQEAMLSNFMLQCQSYTLTTLCFTNELPFNIVPFLESTPQLRHISLGYIPDAPHPIHSLPTDAVPLLEQYSGPTEHSEIFLRDRPIHTVDFRMPYELSANVLLPLKLSSTPVTKLALDFGDSTPNEEYLQDIPTTLQYLHSAITDNLALWRSILSRMTDLRVFEAKCFKRSVTSLKQREAVYTISEDCPSLREIIFDTLKNGRERWRKSSYGLWEHYLIY